MFPRLSELTTISQPVAEETIAEARREGDLADLIEKFCDQNRLYSFEGSRGESNFLKVVNVLGYRSMSDFLEDNSGAIQAMIEWLGTMRNSEWVDAMREATGADEEESDDDEDDDK